LKTLCGYGRKKEGREGEEGTLAPEIRKEGSQTTNNKISN